MGEALLLFTAVRDRSAKIFFIEVCVFQQHFGVGGILLIDSFHPCDALRIFAPEFNQRGDSIMDHFRIIVYAG